MVDKCSPADMRKNLDTVEVFRKEGIDFVAIPVSSNASKAQLLELMLESLSTLEKDADQ